MKYIKRACEEILKNKFRTSKAVAVTGARQVGKTTLTKHLFDNVKRINMRDMALLKSAKEEPLALLKSYGRPLFVDEIQKAPELLDACKVILDEKGEKGSYLFSGSHKWNLMKGMSESLVGMVSILELPALSMREINETNEKIPFLPTEEYIQARKQNVKKCDDIWNFIHKGFYPELYDDDPPEWEEFYRSYVQTYMERDVIDFVKIKDASAFYRFMVAAAARTGNILNYANLAADAGISLETARQWISVLEKSDIILLLQPYFNSHLTRALKTPKLYFRDTGLAAYLTSWLTPQTLQSGAMNGAFFETFVINEIAKSYANAGKNHAGRMFYYRGKDKLKKSKNSKENSVEAEIDLIIEENGILYPIEIKKTSVPTKEMAYAFTVLDKDIGKKRGMGAIICRIEDMLYLRDDLVALPVEYL